MLAQRSLLIRCLIYHPVCASKEGGLFLYGVSHPSCPGGEICWPTNLPQDYSDRLFSRGNSNTTRTKVP
jgi:hypothetical protein